MSCGEMICAPQQRKPRRPVRPRRGGFTLIEATLTMVIISTGVLAILAAQQAYHKKNDWSARSSTAMLLANELRELTLTLPMHDPITNDQFVGAEADEVGIADFDDLDDFAGPVTSGVGAGIVFDPPVNALRLPINDLDGWSQEIRVDNVLEDNISASFTQPLGTTSTARVTVNVRYQGPNAASPQTVTTLTWVILE